MARIDFADHEDTPEAFRGGWVEYHDYLTVAQRQRIDNAGMAFELDAVKIKEVFESLGEGASAKNLTPAQLAEAANLRIDIAASEYADMREAVSSYSITGETTKRGGKDFPDELPEALAWVIDEIRAHYKAGSRTPADRKSVGASV